MKFPLEHGGVATCPVQGPAFNIVMFPLEHGGVATIMLSGYNGTKVVPA